MTDLVTSLINDAITNRKEWIATALEDIGQYEAMIENHKGFIDQYTDEIQQLLAGIDESND